jgi:diphosphomevalonate decarboxylase
MITFLPTRMENDNIPSTRISSVEPAFVSWRSPSNIALIKYWGKDKGQIPRNPSVSITLGKSYTETRVDFTPVEAGAGKLKNFYFEGKKKNSFALRIISWFKRLTALYPFLMDYDLTVESINSFPHSSGIASSASAMSSLALCLTSIERILVNTPAADDDFFRKASFAARLGSGSAARSVYPGFVLWGRFPEIPFSSNEFAIPLNDRIHKNFSDIRDTILIVDESRKAVSSSRGHSLMETNPWSTVRYDQALDNTGRMIRVLASGESDEFIKIIEQEALAIHALMMNSDPGYILMKPGTLEIIQKVRTFRKDTGIPLAFTLDAGPNVHLIYQGVYDNKINGFIQEELLRHCSGQKLIRDSAGQGPVRLNHFQNKSYKKG